MFPARLVLVAALAIACHGALAQTVVPPTVTVQQTAPQLVAFAGSPSNFQNLVNGLAQGTQVQMVTLLPDGFTQIVTFTPAAAMSPAQIAQVLETARQQLIGLGIANPTAEQIAITLMGGVVPTALGGSQVPGTINPQNPQSPAAPAQANAARIGSSTTAPGSGPAAASAGSTTSTTPSTVTPPVNVQIFPPTTSTATTATASPRVNTSDSLTAPGTTSQSPGTSTSASPSAPATPAAPGSSAAATAPAPATALQPGNTNPGLKAAR